MKAKKDDKNDNKIVLYILVFVIIFLLGILIGFTAGIVHFSKDKEKVKEVSEEKEVIKDEKDDIPRKENIDYTMKNVSKYIYHVDKSSFKTKDLTEIEKVNLASNLSEESLEDITGTELIDTFKRYFGKDQSLTFPDIICPSKHQNKEEQVLYSYDKNLDKYVYNNKHPGHGGELNNEISYELKFIKKEKKDDLYHYETKVLFYELIKCPDVGPCTYGNAYSSYKDAKNKTNPLINIGESKKYITNDNDFPIVHIDEVLKDYEDKLPTVDFVFTEENNNIIFKYYNLK